MPDHRQGSMWLFRYACLLGLHQVLLLGRTDVGSDNQNDHAREKPSDLRFDLWGRPVLLSLVILASLMACLAQSSFLDGTLTEQAIAETFRRDYGPARIEPTGPRYLCAHSSRSGQMRMAPLLLAHITSRLGTYTGHAQVQ